jgi:hypothetical protein
MKQIPVSLRGRPFTHLEARAAGVSERMLRGKRFVRVHPRVWRCAEDELSDRDRLTAAQLAMPSDARVTGLTRIQMEGLRFGPAMPLHFVVARDHHIALDGIFLHRTKRMPLTDDKGVAIELAYVAYCATARTLETIKVGDWLLHRGLMDLDRLVTHASAEPWRDGALEAIWVSHHLDARSRSLMESETRCFLSFAGLPLPESNGEVLLDDRRLIAGDLLYRELGLVIEYEGEHHQADRAQYVSDIDRYESLRASGLDYVQVTKEKARRPRRLVLAIHARMEAHGYQGPAPFFGDQWDQLFLPLTVAVVDPSVKFRAS